MRGSPLFTVGDIVAGDAKAGEAYFNGEGACATCHNATARNLAGISTRIPEPVDLQQRMLFPMGGGRGRGRGGRGAPPAGGGDPAAAAQRTGRRRRNAVKVTIAPASGAPMSGVLVEESDFYVTLRESDGTVRVVRRAPGHEDHEDQSAAGAHRPARSRQRQADSRPGCVPGDVEMRALVYCRRRRSVRGDAGRAAAAGARPAAPPRRRPDRRADREAVHRFVADVQRRLLRTPLQQPDEDQRRQRQEPEPGLDLRPAGRRHHQGDAAADWRRPVLHDPESRLRGRRANRARAVALHLQQEPRRHPDRQSRRRGTRQHRLLRHDRLQPGRARHQDRDGEVGEGVLLARDDVLRVGGPGRRQGQADPRAERRRPRRARLPRSPEPGERRSDLALVRHAAEGGRPRPRHLAEPRHGQARRRHDLAAGHLRPRAEPHLRHDRQSRSRSSRSRIAKARTCTPRRSSR